MKPLILIVTTLLALLGIWFGSFPLGVPGEWTWSRLAPPSPLVWSLVLPILVAAIFTGFVWLGARRADGASRWETVAWLAGLVITGVAWLLTVQDAAPQPHNLSKIAWVLFYPGPSGYFTEARRVTDERQFLADYDKLMSRGDVLHIGTHPPGLIVAYRGLIRFCDASPVLVNFLHATMPDSVREMSTVIAEQERMPPVAPFPSGGEEAGVREPTHTRPPFTRRDAAVLWLAGLLVHVLATLTVVPLYYLVRRFHSARSAWLAASLWPTVPALAVFLPKSDAMLPVFAIGFLSLWSGSWSGFPAQSAVGNWRSAFQCLFAGVVLWLGLFFSLALLPVVFLAGVLTMWEGWLCRADDRIATPARRLVIGLACAAAGFLIPIALLYITTGMNLFEVWAWNFHNHAGFYSQFPRTYWKWLLVNPVELSVAAGLPLVVLAIIANCRSRSEWRRRDSGPIWACLTTWLVLWLSGKNMGEAARLWIIIMPWFVWLAARAFDVRWVEERDLPPTSGGSVGLASSTHSTVLWLITLILQFAVTLSIVLNVGGFDVPAVR